jgi:hypothetical protein
MSFYGPTETWKIVYYPKELNGGRRGVALVEAPDKHAAMYNFSQEYAGEYSAIDTCTKLYE